jgi:hypothetical protein
MYKQIDPMKAQKNALPFSLNTQKGTMANLLDEMSVSLPLDRLTTQPMERQVVLAHGGEFLQIQLL